MAAKSSTLGTLHELFAQYWLEQMQRVDEETGKPVPLSAAEAAVLRAFLKDNNVQADPADDGDIKSLANNLRAATGGSVEETEFDAILSDFQNSLSGRGLLQ